jgi:hypothetical protein
MTDTLTIISIQLIRIITPIIIILGIIGNSINIVVLTRSVLLKHACSYYFLALALNNLFVSIVVITTDFLSIGYEIDLSTISLFACKILRYASNTSALLSTSFIILASIDRYCASSSNANRRKFNNIKFARWAIVFVICLFGLLYINSLILFDLRKDNKLQCYIPSDTIYKEIYIIIQVSIFAIIAPCLMTLFGILTIYNTKQLRVLPTETTRYRRTENQLAAMLLIQVGTYVLRNLPICVIYVMRILPYTFVDKTEFSFASIIFRMLNYLSYTTNFFLYVFSSRLYREELSRFMKKIVRVFINNQVQSIVLNDVN